MWVWFSHQAIQTWDLQYNNLLLPGEEIIILGSRANPRKGRSSGLNHDLCLGILPDISLRINTKHILSPSINFWIFVERRHFIASIQKWENVLPGSESNKRTWVIPWGVILAMQSFSESKKPAAEKEKSYYNLFCHGLLCSGSAQHEVWWFLSLAHLLPCIHYYGMGSVNKSHHSSQLGVHSIKWIIAYSWNHPVFCARSSQKAHGASCWTSENFSPSQIPWNHNSSMHCP